MKILQKYPLICAYLLFLLSVGIGEWIAWERNDGHFSYALDDAFIMMAISKNFALHGVWGVTPYEYGSTATSALFALVLAGFYKLFGVTIYGPWILNAIMAFAVLYILNGIMQKEKFQENLRFWLLCLTAFLTPFPVLMFGSMEHLMHTSLFVLLLYLGAREISEGKNEHMKWLYVLAFLAVATRYESCFIVGMIGLWLILKKRIAQGLTLWVVGAMPVFIYGYVSIQNGNYFLPNSILLKGLVTNFLSQYKQENPFTQFLKKFRLGPWLLSIIFLAWWLIATHLKGASKKRHWHYAATLLVLGSAAAHGAFGWVGHVFRYEAYLVGTATFFLLLILIQEIGFDKLLAELKPERLFAAPVQSLFLVALLYLPVARGFYSYAGGLRAKTNIYEQQVQMGLFVKKYYNHRPIAASDIGALTYFADVKMLDLYGLATIDIARAKVEKRYTIELIDSIARSRKLAMGVFFEKELNKKALGWSLVGRWYIKNNVICGDDSVGFYALNDSSARILRSHLMEFEDQLPKTVDYKYFPLFED